MDLTQKLLVDLFRYKWMGGIIPAFFVMQLGNSYEWGIVPTIIFAIVALGVGTIVCVASVMWASVVMEGSARRRRGAFLLKM